MGVVEVEAHRKLVAGGEQVDGVAAQGNLAGLVDVLVPVIAAVGELQAEGFEVDFIASARREDGVVPGA